MLFLTFLLSRSFLSTLSLRRATAALRQAVSSKLYFYPRSPCGERHNTESRIAAENDFYPRSPCGERLFANFDGFYWWVISIHALLAESDGGFGAGSWPRGIFLSTLSLRRATWLRCWQLAARDISIHALLAESDWWLRCWQLAARDISIHALLAESDA